MVKSKKMSKTGIAVIVLAILLVLSLVMGMTGAWYTATAKQTGDSYTLTLRNSFVSFSASSSAAFTVTRDIDNDGTFGEEGVDGEVLTPAEGVYTVLPGDHVAGSGAVTFTVTNEGDDAFWYAIYKDGVRVSGDAAIHVESGHADIVRDGILDLDNKTLETDKAGLTGSAGSWVVNTALTTASMGQTVAIFDIADYEIFAIQSENLTAAQALIELDALAAAANA